MFGRISIFIALVLVAGGIGLGSLGSASADKAVTLSPSSGIVGTAVEAKLTGATPGTELTVVFKIGGDPVLDVETVDANGNATFNFVIPWTPGGTYTLFFTDFLCNCQIGVPFTVTVARQTPTPTATPTTPPQPTVTTTPTPTAIATEPPPTATPTPGVPVLGTTDGFGMGGPNVGVLGLGMLAVLTVLAWFAATRRDGTSLASAAPVPYDDGPDGYSTELDLATLEGMRRPRPFAEPAVTTTGRDGRASWAIGAGIAAVTGAILLFRRK